MSALAAIYPNSDVRSSGKRGKKSANPRRASALKLAAELARQIGMVPTWPNVQTIRLAIESEAGYSEVSISQAAALIATAANDFSVVDPQMYSFEAAHLMRKSNVIDRFWFEDARWRYKDAYNALLARLQRESAEEAAL